MNGYINIYRSLLDWEWFESSETLHLFIYLLLVANYEDKTFRGIVVKRGQAVVSRRKIVSATGMSERKIRTCIERLVSTDEIIIESSNQYSIVTICNYDRYQIRNENSDQQTTNKRPTNDPHTKKEKSSSEETFSLSKDNSKEKKDELSLKQTKSSIEENKRLLKIREQKFTEELRPYVEIFGSEMCNNFYRYWTEPNKIFTKMRFELEKTWDLKRRLSNWDKRNFKR